MKPNRKLYGVTACLLLLAAILAVIHFATRTEVPEGTIAVEINGTPSCLALDDLAATHITGEIVNGRGERSTVDGQGIWLRDVLAMAGAENPGRVTAIADDEYSAVIEGEELAQGIQACLLVENGEGRLVVFGDPNSKRNVAGLTRLVIE